MNRYQQNKLLKHLFQNVCSKCMLWISLNYMWKTKMKTNVRGMKKIKERTIYVLSLILTCVKTKCLQMTQRSYKVFREFSLVFQLSLEIFIEET